MKLLPDNPIVLTIAGFDPSGCAGLLADVKTFEANGVHSMGVCTANTEQNVSSFLRPNWIKRDEIFRQLELLQQEVNFEFVKIGLVESFDLLEQLVARLVKLNPGVKIIWDPVCKASADFVFHTAIQQGLLENIGRQLYLVTPNLDELQVLTPGRYTEEAGNYLAQFCNVLVKGGHGATEKSIDTLFTKQETHYFEGERLAGVSKRGTGCVLSAAILANLAKGKTLVKACGNARQYIHHYLTSNPSLVGSHVYENQ